MTSNHQSAGPQTVVVTGATAGVGRAVVREYARRGAKIGLIAREESRLEQTKAEVESLGGQAIVLPTDVADEDQIEKAAETTERELGPIDIWVNNAMVTILAPFDEIEPDEFRRVSEVNYLGYVWGTMAALKRMKPRDAGTIVQVGSALAYRSVPLQSAYCGSKFAIRGFTDSIRSELIHDGSNVHITMVQLPAVNTPQFGWSRSKMPSHPKPVAPIFQPEVAAEAIVLAGDEKRREVYVGRSAVQTIIGNKVAPEVGDWVLSKQGYTGQQAPDLDYDPNRPDNLFEPVPGDEQARGKFNDQAENVSAQLWLTKHRKLAAGLVVGSLLTTLGVGKALGIGRRS